VDALVAVDELRHVEVAREAAEDIGVPGVVYSESGQLLTASFMVAAVGGERGARRAREPRR
jgi:hypothetical protein